MKNQQEKVRKLFEKIIKNAKKVKKTYILMFDLLFEMIYPLYIE